MGFPFVGGPYDGAVITRGEINDKCELMGGASMIMLPPPALWDAWTRTDFDRDAAGCSWYKRDATTLPPIYRFVRQAGDLPA
jgi:hypothetical protein